MGPSPDDCGQLLRPMTALLDLKHFADQRAARENPRLPRAALTVLAELVRTGGARACDLASARVVAASVVSRQLAQLERAELISRRPDPDDGRVSLLRATPAGERVIADQEQRQAQWLCRALEGWSDAEVRRLAGLLEGMTADIRRAAQEEGEGAK
jgi:DNA-binding MarR family transcriptional regulator